MFTSAVAVSRNFHYFEELLNPNSVCKPDVNAVGLWPPPLQWRFGRQTLPVAPGLLRTLCAT